MKKLNRLFALFLSLILVISLVGCKEKTQEDIQKSYHTFLDKVFKDQVTSDSLSLHYTLANPENYGIKNIKPTLGTFSIDQMKKDIIDAENNRNKLQEFNYDWLTKEDQITYEILNDVFSKNLAIGTYPYLVEQLGPTTGLQAQLPILFAEYAFYSKDDITTYIKLLNCVDDYFTSLEEFEKEKSQKGYFMTDDIVDDIIAQCQDFIKSPEDNFLITSFKERMEIIPDLTDKEKSDFEEKNKAAILTSVIPAYHSLIDTLISLKGSSKNENGLCGFEGGKEYYELKVQSSTGSSKTIPEMKRSLKALLNRCLSTITTLSIKDPTLYDQYINITFPETEPNATMEYLAAQITKDFPVLDSVNYTVKYVPDSLENHLSPAMYLVPPIDFYTENCIYINDNPNFDMTKLFPTIAHEGYPGHLYQNVYFRKLNKHPIRSVINVTGYDEGWATYVECYSYGIAGLSQNLSDFLKANMIAVHCLYSLTDIGIHYEEWTKEETIDFWSNYVSSPEDAEGIYNSILGEPGIYLPYCVGYIEIMELKSLAKSTLQENFRLKDFHTFLLDFGPAPYDIIEKYLKNWLTEKTGSNSEKK